MRRALLAVLACTCIAGAHAAAPLQRTQGPGFYRLMLGDFEITALSDGVFDLKTDEMLTNIAPERRMKLLTEAFEGDSVATSVNAYLINTGDMLVLVDAGAADRFGPTLGHLIDNLVASGYRPEQVDRVLVTHMHPDHIGGLLIDGKRAFPNATIHVEQREADFWLNPQSLARAPADRKGFFQAAAAAIAPYASAGRFRTFVGRTDLFSGISAVPAPGHTPGHSIYVIESKGEKLVLWGDLMEVAAIQFIEPAATIVYDDDATEAAGQRPKAYADAAQHRDLIAVSHLPFPGIGHVRRERNGYAWVPIPYADVR